MSSDLERLQEDSHGGRAAEHQAIAHGPSTMKGEVVSHFRIHELIGRGGMGEVYRAEDLRLGREVALKFLPSEVDPDERQRTRFIREARAASALDHPNICTIFEVDETEEGRIFLAMAYYRGQSLRDRIRSGALETPEAVDVALQLARGLERAHEAGIVHRDLKPGNVFVTREGLVKLLDFGLAKLAGGTQVTRSGAAVGTVGYMAPEQVLGREVDHRADLWSFGVILFEMLAGELPFRGESDASTMFAVVHEDAASLRGIRPDLPEALHRIVERCLGKDPVDRYGGASALRRDLERLHAEVESIDVQPTEGWLPAPARPSRSLPRSREPKQPVWRRRGARIAGSTILGLALLALLLWSLRDRGGGEAAALRAEGGHLSLAVLPLTNLTGQAELDYVPEGIGAVLIGQLAQIPGVDVVAREEAWAYRRRHPSASPRDVARELGVDAILEGQYLAHGERSRIHLSLVDAATGFVSWSQTVEAPGGRLLDLQDEVSARVVERLGAGTDVPRGPPAGLTSSEEAYRFYARGEALLAGEPSDQDVAAEMFRQAIAADPGFALAHARLSETLSEKARQGDGDAKAEARRHAERALRLAPDLPEARLAHAGVLEGTGELDRAIEELRSLVALHPDLERARNRLTIAYRKEGRYAEAERTIRQAIRRRPDYWKHWDALGGLLLRQGEYDEARESFQKAAVLTQLDYGTPYEHLAALELMQGNFEAALDAFERLPRPIENPNVASNLGTTHFYLGNLEEAARHYRLALRLAPSPAYHANLGDVYARQGDLERARREYGRSADRTTADTTRGRIQRALYLGKAGRCQEALPEAGQLETEVELTAQDAAFLAKTHGACGEAEGALRLLQRALDLGYDAEVARGEEEFRDLVGDPRFEAILEGSKGAEAPAR